MSANNVTQEIQDSVSSLYIAFFGRAPDAKGFGYWAEKEAAGVSPFAIAADFARSEEWLSNYGGLTPTEQVTLFYQNVFGRDPDTAGLNYWVKEINGGLPASTVAYQIIWAAYKGGPNVDPDDTAIVKNKIAVAEYFAMDLKSNDTAIAATAFEGVTQDESTVDAAEARLDAAVNPAPTYTLTTAIVADDAGTLPVKYNLSDTQTNLGKNLSVAQEVAKAEQAQDIIDGALNASSLGQLAVTYTLLDSLANIYLADPAVVSGASSYSLTTTSVNLTPATTIAATAEALAALQDVIDGAATGKGPLAATYSLADTLANLSNPANADIVAGTTAWTLTNAAGNLGTLTQEQAAVVAGATNAASYTYNTAFTLTSEPDTVTLADNVQVFDAPKVYNPGGTDLINSLQNEDNLTANTQGGTQATSLSADLGNPNDSGTTLINPIMNNIETLNIAFTNTVSSLSGSSYPQYLTGYDSTGMTLDLEDTVATDTVNMTRITGFNRASIINMDGQEVNTISVSNSNAQSQALFTFLNSTMGQGATNTLAVNLNNAALFDKNYGLDQKINAALVISSTDPQGSEYQEGIEVFNITVGGTSGSTVATFDTGYTAYDDIVPGELPQTLNITANQNFDIGTFRWLGNRVENVSATDANFLRDSRHAVGSNGLGLTRHDQITKITVAGAGNVSLANVGSYEVVNPTDGNSAVDFVLDASKLTGNIQADITNAAYSTDKDTSITGGSGINKFYVAGKDVVTSVSAGAGVKDSLTVQSATGQNVALRAGTGIETLNLVASDNASSSSWDADLTYGGYNEVTINNQSRADGDMTVTVVGADVGNTIFSIRSQGLDKDDQSDTLLTQGRVKLDIAQAADATGDTLTLHLGEAADDRGTTNAFSWQNYTNNIDLNNTTVETNEDDEEVDLPSIDNLDLVINSAGFSSATKVAPVNLKLDVEDFVDTMTVTTGTDATNTFNAGAIVGPNFTPIRTNYDDADDGNAIGSETYDGSAYNGVQNLIFGGTQGRQVTAGKGSTAAYAGQTVLTGTAADWIDLSYIETDTGNTVAGYRTSTFLLNSTVNSAAGSDTVVLSADLSDPRTVLEKDVTYDDWFANWIGVENLIINNRLVTSAYVSYDWDAQQAGLQTVSFTAVDNDTVKNTIEGGLSSAEIYVGDDYTGNAAQLTINSNVISNQTIDSRSLVDIVANINNPDLTGGSEPGVLIRSTGATLDGVNDNDFTLNYNNILGSLSITGAASLADGNLAVARGSLDFVNFKGDTNGTGTVHVITNDALTASKETTQYDFRGVVNNLVANNGTVGQVLFTAEGELDSPGLTIYGSTDGGPTTGTGANTGVVSNTLTGSKGSFANGLGNDTIVSGGYRDSIDGLGGNDNITYTNADKDNAVGVTIDGSEGNDTITVTASSATATIDVDGGQNDDSITVTSTSDTVTLDGGAGYDTINGGAGDNRIVGNTDADSMTLFKAATAAANGDDTVYQGIADSIANTTARINASGNFTAGDSITFGNSVDVVYNFVAGANQDAVELQAAPVGAAVSQSLLGTSANVGSYGWLSGNYSSTTGVFEITGNGLGKDTLVLQTGNVLDFNSNRSAIVLVGVDTDLLENSNFKGANSLAAAWNGTNNDLTLTGTQNGVTTVDVTQTVLNSVVMNGPIPVFPTTTGTAYNRANVDKVDMSGVSGSAGAVVTISSANATLIGATGTVIGTLSGTTTLAVTESLTLATTMTLTNVDAITLADNVNVTLDRAKNALITSAGNTNTVTLSDAGEATGAAQVENYILANGTNTFTLGSNNQNVTGGTGNDKVVVGSRTLTGNTIALAAGTNTVDIADGGNISSATLTATGGTYDLNITGVNASITVTAAQLTGGGVTETTAGVKTVTVASGAVGSSGSYYTIDAQIDSLILANATNYVTLGAAAQSVTGGSGSDTLAVGSTVATGDVSGVETITATSGSIAGVNKGGATGATTLTLLAGDLDLTIAQVEGFATINFSGDSPRTAADGLTISGTGSVNLSDQTITGLAGTSNIDDSITLSSGVTGLTIDGTDMGTTGGIIITGQAGDTNTLTLNSAYAGTLMGGAVPSDGQTRLDSIENLVFGNFETKLAASALGVLASITGGNGSSSKITVSAADSSGDFDLSSETVTAVKIIDAGILATDKTLSINGNTFNGLTSVLGDATNDDVKLSVTTSGQNLTLVEDGFKALSIGAGATVEVGSSFIGNTSASSFATISGQTTTKETFVISAVSPTAAVSLAAITSASELDAILMNDGGGVNTMTVSNTNAVRAITTVDLGEGGDDIVSITDTSLAASASDEAIILSFGTGDKLDLSANGQALNAQYQTFTSAGSALVANTDGSVWMMASALDELVDFTNTTAAINLIANAVGTATVADGDVFAVVIYGSEGAGVYAIETDVLSNAQFVAASITNIELLAVLDNVAADSISSANFM